MQSIPEKNFVLLLDPEKGIAAFLESESIGGNTSMIAGYLSTSANFYYDENTGEIFVFTNNIIEKKGWHSGVFRVLVNTNIKDAVTPRYFRIVDYILREESSKTAIKNLEETSGLYNQYMSNIKNLRLLEKRNRSLLYRGKKLLGKLVGVG